MSRHSRGSLYFRLNNLSVPANITLCWQQICIMKRILNKTTACALQLCDSSLIKCCVSFTKLKASTRLTHCPFTCCPACVCVCVCVRVLIWIKYLAISTSSFLLFNWQFCATSLHNCIKFCLVCWPCVLGCVLYCYGSGGSSVNIVTSYRMNVKQKNHGWICRRHRSFSSVKHLEVLCLLPFHWRLTICLYLVGRLRMSGAIFHSPIHLCTMVFN